MDWVISGAWGRGEGGCRLCFLFCFLTMFWEEWLRRKDWMIEDMTKWWLFLIEELDALTTIRTEEGKWWYQNRLWMDQRTKGTEEVGELGSSAQVEGAGPNRTVAHWLRWKIQGKIQRYWRYKDTREDVGTYMCFWEGRWETIRQYLCPWFS